MSYIPAFRYLGSYENSYKSYTPNVDKLNSFSKIIDSWGSSSDLTETDVVNRIDYILKELKYGNSINITRKLN